MTATRTPPPPYDFGQSIDFYWASRRLAFTPAVWAQVDSLAADVVKYIERDLGPDADLVLAGKAVLLATASTASFARPGESSTIMRNLIDSTVAVRLIQLGGGLR